MYLSQCLHMGASLPTSSPPPKTTVKNHSQDILMQHLPSDAANAYPSRRSEGSVGSEVTDIHTKGTSQASHNYSGADLLVPAPTSKRRACFV